MTNAQIMATEALAKADRGEIVIEADHREALERMATTGHAIDPNKMQTLRESIKAR